MMWCPIRRLFLLLMVAVGIVACGSDADLTGRQAVSPSITSTTTTTTTTSVSVTTTSTTTTTTTTLAPELAQDGDARVIRTTTDVVLPVLAVLDDGWAVRTPCQRVELVTAGTPIERVHVVVDAGHGGTEPGAVADDITEASINLRVAGLVEEQLTDAGFVVLGTRYTDIRVPILTRVEVAEAVDAALVVSVHHQGLGQLPRSDTPGTEIYYQQNNEESRRFAGLIREEAVKELGAFEVEGGWFAGPDVGATTRPATTGEDFYGMVRRPTMPAVLAEMSFMGNPGELALLQTEPFLEAEARSITAAVVRWFTTDDPGSGFAESSFTISSSGGGGGLGNCTDPDLGPTAEFPPDFDVASVGSP
ncbi:MAG: N-acetylmuramoyl-L-alanine amidase [Acidimicrobiales bacterium]|nr:MAG: N-acetylmuramoyl-L-alanine amidase [Acidimicrobiales bacterium]